MPSDTWDSRNPRAPPDRNGRGNETVIDLTGGSSPEANRRADQSARRHREAPRPHLRQQPRTQDIATRPEGVASNGYYPQTGPRPEPPIGETAILLSDQDEEETEAGGTDEDSTFGSLFGEPGELGGGQTQSSGDINTGRAPARAGPVNELTDNPTRATRLAWLANNMSVSRTRENDDDVILVSDNSVRPPRPAPRVGEAGGVRMVPGQQLGTFNGANSRYTSLASHISSVMRHMGPPLDYLTQFVGSEFFPRQAPVRITEEQLESRRRLREEGLLRQSLANMGDSEFSSSGSSPGSSMEGYPSMYDIPLPEPSGPAVTVPEGFTSDLKEDEEYVCPNCGNELMSSTRKDGAEGQPETDLALKTLRQQVWVVKQCGHAYCGFCTKYRAKSKRTQARSVGLKMESPFQQCVVEGCTASCRDKRAMQQIYL